jgi:hypothetical protein
VAGTLIATSQGEKAIEEIQVGDQVWSRNEETGERRLREVVDLFVTPDQETLELDLISSDGSTETLGVTTEHPFWVVGHGWTEAGELNPGDEIFTAKDGWLKVRQVRGSPDRHTVYNFEVAEDHSYFVGETEAWVHNQCHTKTGGIRQRVERNLAESRKARESSRFGDYVKRRERPALARIKGVEGERLAGTPRPQKAIESITGTATRRFPDELGATFLKEVKNRAVVRYTNQIQDFLLYAQRKQLDFILVVRKNTSLAPAIEALEQAGKIIVKRDLPSR